MPDMVGNQKVMVELHDAANVGTYVQVKKSSKPYEMVVPIQMLADMLYRY
jgi:hypothetical protein